MTALGINRSFLHHSNIAVALLHCIDGAGSLLHHVDSAWSLLHCISGTGSLLHHINGVPALDQWHYAPLYDYWQSHMTASSHLGLMPNRQQ